MHERMIGREAAVSARLTGLINQPSQTFNIPGVTAFQQALSHTWSGMFDSCELIPISDRGPLLVAERRGESDAAPTLVLLHADTAYRVDQHSPARVEGDKIFGSGAVDLKGAIVMVELALSVLSRQPNIRVVVNSAEEDSSPDTRIAMQEAARGCTQAVVCEFGRQNDGIVVARKSRAIYRLKASGRGGHAAKAFDPNKNPMVVLAKAIGSISVLADVGKRVSLNFGSWGPEAPVNSVPSEVWADFEVRTLNFAQLSEIHRAIRAMVEGLTTADVKVSFEQSSFTQALEDGREDSYTMAAHYQMVASELDCRDPAILECQDGLSDANLIAGVIDGGIIDGVGPSGGGEHSHGNEWVSVESILQKAGWLAALLERI